MTRTPWHARSVQDALSRWQSDPDAGLSAETVASRRAQLGPNELPRPQPKSALRQLFSQLADPLVGALLVAAMVSLGVALSEAPNGQSALARFGDTFAILLIVSVNALLGFFQERRAERALDALQKMAAPEATVLREGALTVVEASELVPGDIVQLAPGDAVPADIRLIEASEFATEEAALTGESTPVTKEERDTLPEPTPIAERANVLHLGTTVTRGRARGVVVATGAYTELGRIGTLMGSIERGQTPLEQQLERLGRFILVICLAVSALLFVIGVLQGGRSWTVMLLTAVSLAVAAIPEGLPAITTITLAIGMQRMAHRGAIVRKLSAVETLGSATIICSDKTGTLTQNAMSVRHIVTVDGVFDVSGEGYGARGEVTQEGEAIERAPDALRWIAEISTLCNDATLEGQTEDRTLLGDPTEGALLALADRLGIDRAELSGRSPVERRFPFDGDRKRMTVLAGGTLYTKGSPVGVLARCDRMWAADGARPLDDTTRARLAAVNDGLASLALRVLALAFRAAPDSPETADEAERGLVFVGLVAMVDPPRPDVKQAIAQCRSAGIQVVMITGDHELTATAIAKEIGLWQATSRALTGPALVEMSDQRLLSELDDVAVFARTSAEQKLRLVQLLEQRGHVVAMTGDGVNDAPALKEAAIGVAMGLGGTDVARNAAEMVLADDNFATIVEAVREGRATFRNIQKFIFFLNSSNAGLVVAVIVGSFFDFMPQLTPLQLLWINLVTNGLPALALGVDPPDPTQMREPPRPADEAIVGRTDLLGMLLVGLIMGGAALGLMWIPHLWPGLIAGDGPEALQRCRAMAFTLLAVSPLFHAFSCRSRWRSAFAQPFENRALWLAVALSFAVHAVTIVVPDLHEVFGTHLLSATEWGIVLCLAVMPVPVFEFIKVVIRHGREEPVTGTP